MHLSLARLALPLLCLLPLAAFQMTASAQTPVGPVSHGQRPGGGPSGQSPTAGSAAGPLASIRGIVVDGSAGVLPGVTVVASSVDGQPLATTVTNAVGEYKIDGLPAGRVELVFHLDGFGPSRASVAMPRASPGSDRGEVWLEQRLELAARTESVVVRGDPPAAPPPPPPPAIVPVPAHDQDSVCGPAKAEGAVPLLGTVRSRRNDLGRAIFAAGDELLIDGGALTGLRVGQNMVVRRRFPTPRTNLRAPLVTGEHSSGLLQIVAVEDRFATAVVVYACDEIMKGDYLVAFEPGPMIVPEPVGIPAFEVAAKVLFADAGQLLGMTRRMLVIDRGMQHGVRPGQRLTLFRRPRRGDPTSAIVGEAVVVAVRTDSATIRVEQAIDIILFGEKGDWAAPQHRSSPWRDLARAPER